MAIYIEIDKIFEEKEFVAYRFNSGIPECYDIGILKVNKETGDCAVKKSMPGDIDNKIAGYAYRAILKYWKNGEFPDKISYST